MRLVDNSVTPYIQEPGIEGLYKAIRDAAVICYQTDVDKMKLSPKEFVEQVLLANGHTRPLEFGTVYLKIPSMAYEEPRSFDSRAYGRYEKYMGKPLWTHMNGLNSDGYWYITTNMRIIMQGDYITDKEAWGHGYDKSWLRDVYDFWCEPNDFHERRYTYTMIASRGCTDDFRTHISLSSICESTRFCNYSKNKFDSSLTFINPTWWDDDIRDTIIKSNEVEEKIYLEASMVCKEAQQLKRILPLNIKAELRICGYLDALDNFFWRRLDSHADPECQLVASMINKELDLIRNE